MRTLFLILVRALGVIKFLIKIEFRPLNFSLKRARVDVSRQNPHLHIISHSSGGFVVIIIVVGFMGHWSQLLAVVHGSLAACTRTQAAIMHSCTHALSSMFKVTLYKCNIHEHTDYWQLNMFKVTLYKCNIHKHTDYWQLNMCIPSGLNLRC